MQRKKEYIATFDELGFYAPKKVQELVRCRDCRFYREDDGKCSVWSAHRHEDGFCDKAGRKEE